MIESITHQFCEIDGTCFSKRQWDIRCLYQDWRKWVLDNFPEGLKNNGILVILDFEFTKYGGYANLSVEIRKICKKNSIIMFKPPKDSQGNVDLSSLIRDRRRVLCSQNLFSPLTFNCTFIKAF